MAIVTEVRFAHPDGALARTLTELPGLEVTVVRETSTVPDQRMYFLRFDHDDAGAVESLLADDPSVAAVRPIPEFEDLRWIGVEFADSTELLGPRVSSNGGFVANARSATTSAGTRGWHEQWLLPDAEGVHDVWEHAREAGFDFEILELRQRGPDRLEYPEPAALTDHQREALTLAYEEGYFSEPREADLEALADRLDLSPSAVGGRLRRGMKALIGRALTVDEPGSER